MMDVNAKYKRWGWAALIGLVAVIIVAGLIVAVTLARDPKPSDDVIVEGQESSEIVSGTVEGEDEASTESPVETTPVVTPSEDEGVAEMPKTGAENVLPAFALMAVVAALVAYNCNLRAERVFQQK